MCIPQILKILNFFFKEINILDAQCNFGSLAKEKLITNHRYANVCKVEV
jgi:hypothetical protein